MHQSQQCLADASSSIPSDRTQVQSKQKAITTDRDQDNSSKGIHSMEATIPVLHVGKKEVTINN
jgi:hypothetical protein